MGFPEAEVRSCLRAALGNPDIAVEYLTNGIPAMAAATAAPSISATPGSDPLQALRNHPQFDALRRLVQTNPTMLQAVLTQIGQQQPELLQAINNNQAAFLQMMNEPLTDTPSIATTPTPAAPTTSSSSSSSRPSTTSRTAPPSALDGLTNPVQMAQMLSNLSPAELNEMANMMGITPDQLTAMAQMIGQMGNQEQFQEYMMQALQQGGGGSGGAAAAGLGPQIVRLTEEEMAAVNRLAEMGFDHTEAVQAFLACDKNEALAANFLMDSAASGDGFFGDDNVGGGNGGNDDGDDMYD